MSLNTANKIFLCVGLIDLVGLFVWLGVTLHLAYTKMDIMLIHLKNSPAVTIRVPFKNGGPWGKLFLLGGIMSAVTTPGIYLRDGGVNIEEIKSFPTHLKRKLVILQWAGWVLLTLMFGLWAAVTLDLI
ncbi:hypothetical protein C4E44_14970 [Pseudomonas sp. MWU12-2312b]|nr:hypothetical protein C4E44_14970 [Pseudomonas sp. MWU12-2312b]